MVASGIHPVERVAGELDRLRSHNAFLRGELEITDQKVTDAAQELARYLPSRERMLYETSPATRQKVRDIARAVLEAPTQAVINRAIAAEEDEWAARRRGP